MEFWTIPRAWPGETIFIVGGGPSVRLADLEKLRGRRVIAVNSSCFTVPWCDYVFTTDARWLLHHAEALKAFAGRIVTSASKVEMAGVLHVMRQYPPGLAAAANAVVCRNTSLHGAINLAVHKGAARIVLLGADGKAAPDGRTHHHAPHPWRVVAGCWDRQKLDLATLPAALKARGVELVNASPGSAWADLWPVVTFDDALAWAGPRPASSQALGGEAAIEAVPPPSPSPGRLRRPPSPWRGEGAGQPEAQLARETCEIHGVSLIRPGDMVLNHAERTGEAFEPVSMAAWLEAAQAGGLMVDVGAYSGLYAIAAAKAGAKALALEPNPAACERLEANFAINDRALADRGNLAVRILATAASDRAGEAQLSVNPKVFITSGGSLQRPTGRMIPVATDTLDNLARDHFPGEAVAAIKIDVEGHEPAVLRGARGIIERHRPLIIAEANSPAHEAEARAELEPFGYALERVDGRNLICRSSARPDKPLGRRPRQAPARAGRPRKAAAAPVGRRLTVACVLRSGGCYTPEYVVRLKAGVAAHLALPHRFVCLTDVADCLAVDGVEPVPLVTEWPGWLAKIELFRPGLFAAGEPALYLDLDTLVTGSLDALAAHPHRFSMLSDFYRPQHPASGVMAWAGGHHHVFEDFGAPELVARHARWHAEHRGDGGWIAARLHPPADRLQDLFPGAIVSRKRPASPKAEASLVCFHGKPRPHEVAWAA